MSEAILTQDVNRHKNMLIIGSGKTNYMLNQITYFETYKSVLEEYGESNLSAAFKVAKDFGVKDVFVMNIKNLYDYFDIVTLLKHNDFAYIVPVDLLMSDTYRDAYRDNRKVTYFQYLLEAIGKLNDSTFVVTDKHASLYEDVDAFLDDMHGLHNSFKAAITPNVHGQNIVFVANNLKEHAMANVVLASALCVSDLDIYPSGSFGDAIFDIDAFDVAGDIAYFKSHTLRDTTVENLVNYCSQGPEKIVTIDRIIKYIKREIDFTEFKGKTYTGYQKLRIEKKLKVFLNALEGYVLDKYHIESITAYQDAPGTVTVLNRFDIWPVNSIEKCSVGIGVEVG